MAAPSSSKPTIVIRLPNWIGDVCMCLPALETLQQTQHPLIVCARPWARDIIAQFNAVQFISLSGRFLSDRRAIASIDRSVRSASLGLVMPDSFSSAALFASTGIASCGYRDDGRSLLLRHACRKPDHPLHAVHKWWQLTRFAIERWQLTSPALEQAQPPTVLLDISTPDQAIAHQVLEKQGLDQHPFILIAPTATGLHHGQIKVWPHFEALAQALEGLGIQVVMCPPASEREQAQAACPSARLLDPLPLKAFCALTQMASLVVCNDSGVSHLAAASGANQITLFGVTDPRNTGPWSDKAKHLGRLGQWPSLAAVLDQVTRSMAPETTHPYLIQERTH